MDEPRQLTLAVDDPSTPREEREPPALATITISGRLGVGRDLYRRDRLRVVVTGDAGEVVATGLASVLRVAFEEREERNRTYTERAHRLRLD